MKTISFMLPAIPTTPIGGYKVVYEYANRLASDGYHVNIMYPAYLYKSNRSNITKILRFVFAFIRYSYYGITKKYKANWFTLLKNVNERLVWSLTENNIPVSDFYIATSVRTAIYLKEFLCNVNRKYYLIQHYENWDGVTINMIIDTYKYPFKKLVISNWLKTEVAKYDNTCHLLLNGFDFNYFKKSIPLEKRNKFCISMLYHKQEIKGCKDGFQALNIVKQKYPNLIVKIFGVYPRPKDLPDWFEYFRSPDRHTINMIYNSSSIFMGTSWSEGWGLTIGEAMICGCAIVCTDNPGYKEMAIDNKTALISSIKDPIAIAKNIIKLIENDELRFNIANQGRLYIQQFSWGDSYLKLRSLLEND